MMSVNCSWTNRIPAERAASMRAVGSVFVSASGLVATVNGTSSGAADGARSVPGSAVVDGGQRIRPAALATGRDQPQADGLQERRLRLRCAGVRTSAMHAVHISLYR